jgi:two-component system response regulator HydG
LHDIPWVKKGDHDSFEKKATGFSSSTMIRPPDHPQDHYRSWGYPVDTADDGETAVSHDPFRTRGSGPHGCAHDQMSGIEALGTNQRLQPHHTRYHHDRLFVGGIGGGCPQSRRLRLPDQTAGFRSAQITIERACEHSGLKAENERSEAQLNADFDMANIIGKSDAMKELMEMLAMVAPIRGHGA